MRHLFWISCFCGFQVLFMCFWWKHHFLYKYQSSWKPSKPGQYVCIHALFTHTCTTKYHQNIRYTLLAFPLYSMKDQIKMRHLCWISYFCCFSGAFHVLFMKKCHFSWKPTKPGQYVCIHATFTHTCTTRHHQLPPTYKIYLVGFPSVLYERSGQNETSVLNQLFLWLFRCFSCAFDKSTPFYTRSASLHDFLYKKCHFSWKPSKPGQYMCIHALFTHTCTTKYHQIPLKYKIYFAGFPSVLYERPGQNETSVLNQLFLWLFRWFSCAFYEKVPLFMKTNKTRSICVYTYNIYTYMHHMHHQLPPNIWYTWLTFPLYYMKDQVKMRHLCWISCFCGFQVRFLCFWWKHHFLYKKCNFSWKLKTRSICVYTCTIYTYMHHQIPPKYKIYLVGLPSVHYERPGQNETSVLNQLFFVAFQVLFMCFSWKSATFHENQENQVNMCVYMHHLHIHAPPITTKYKIYLVDLPSVLYERSGQNETSVLNQLFLWLSGAFHVLLMKAPLFIQEVPLFMKTKKTRSICVYTCTIYTYMHHQIPPNTTKI